MNELIVFFYHHLNLRIPIPLSATSLFIFFKMFMFIACKSRYSHKNRQYSDYLYMFFLFFKGVSMVKDQTVSLENVHFNLKLYISTFICHIFLKKIPLKLPLFAVQNGVSVFRNFS